MRRAIAILAVLTLLLPWMGAAADAAAPSVGDMGDGVLRAQLRLWDLGYQTAGAVGVWRISDARALEAFIAAGGAWESLFSDDAPRPAEETDTAQTTMIYGGAMPWSEVKTRLTAGMSYTLTDCYTGVIVRVSYTGGEYAADMQPELSWDNATLVSLFGSGGPFEVRPAVLSIDGMLVAASMRLAPDTPEGELARLQVHFKGSGAVLGGLTDADHAAAVAIAATAPQ